MQLRIAQPQRPTRKQKGEIAEMAFAAKALSLGFNVSRPYAETCYDFVVERRGRLARVQVKSGWKEFHGGYPVKMSNYSRPYRPDEVDFIVVFLPPEDAWYVVPIAAVTRRRTTSFYPNVPHSRGALERFREAWELLTAVAIPGDRHKRFSSRASNKKPLSSRARTGRTFPVRVEGPWGSLATSPESSGPLLTATQAARSRRARAAWSALGDFLIR